MKDNTSGKDVARFGDSTDHGGTVVHVADNVMRGGFRALSIGDEFGGGAGFGLLGSSASLRGSEALHQLDDNSGAVEDANIIASLYSQYLRFLDDPLSFAEWAIPHTQEATPSALPLQAERGLGLLTMVELPPQPVKPVAKPEGIMELLRPPVKLEQLFGDLSGVPDLCEPEQRNDVLGLFAPAEFLAAASRHAAQRLPELARREHHMVAMDSPVSLPVGLLPDSETS
ncbi:TagK domain-containing protein [Burkholderia contaminans]|uniref:TagK domain-containing protein n=1 Tax=Burkholderia contaminans TaxID=488447 RepID=UPI0031128C1E